MIKQRTRVRSVSNVAASKTALIELPCGPRYHSIGLTYTDSTATAADTIAATISEIRIKVNGRVQRTMSGTQLHAIYTMYAAAHGATLVGTKQACIPIHFAEPWRKNPVDQDALAWPSNGWTSFQIEIDLPSTHSALSVFAVTDNLVVNNEPGIVKWIRQNFAAAGLTVDISTMDRRDWLQQITLWDPGTGTINRVVLKKDGVVLHDLDVDEQQGLLTQWGMVPPASGRYELVLDHDDLLGSAVPLNASRDLLLSIEAAGSTAFVGSITAIVQRLGPAE